MVNNAIVVEVVEQEKFSKRIFLIITFALLKRVKILTFPYKIRRETINLHKMTSLEVYWSNFSSILYHFKNPKIKFKWIY